MGKPSVPAPGGGSAKHLLPRRRWVLGLMDRGWRTGENGCDEREPAMMSLLHNAGRLGLGFYNNSSTRYIQQQRRGLQLEILCLFPFPPHL